MTTEWRLLPINFHLVIFTDEGGHWGKVIVYDLIA